MARAAAFFDLDGTLLTANSADLWVRRERRLGHISRLQVARAALYLGGYRLGILDIDKALRSALATLRGTDEAWLRAETATWWREDVRPYLAPGARPVIARHREQGDPLVLLTSSSRYASERAAEDFGLEHVLCQGYEVESGRLTGRPLLPICYGQGKVVIAERWAAAHEVDLGQSSFYSDSYTDLPMLARVGHPFAVAPDLRLSREARRRGWPISSWQT
jgi:HAD superfamily hydrolase (TIGR01490 family)